MTIKVWGKTPRDEFRKAILLCIANATIRPHETREEFARSMQSMGEIWPNWLEVAIHVPLMLSDVDDGRPQ